MAHHKCVRSVTTESQEFVTSTTKFETEEVEDGQVETRLETVEEVGDAWNRRDSEHTVVGH